MRISIRKFLFLFTKTVGRHLFPELFFVELFPSLFIVEILVLYYDHFCQLLSVFVIINIFGHFYIIFEPCKLLLLGYGHQCIAGCSFYRTPFLQVTVHNSAKRYHMPREPCIKWVSIIWVRSSVTRNPQTSYFRAVLRR